MKRKMPLTEFTYYNSNGMLLKSVTTTKKGTAQTKPKPNTNTAIDAEINLETM